MELPLINPQPVDRLQLIKNVGELLRNVVESQGKARGHLIFGERILETN